MKTVSTYYCMKKMINIFQCPRSRNCRYCNFNRCGLVYKTIFVFLLTERLQCSQRLIMGTAEAVMKTAFKAEWQ